MRFNIKIVLHVSNYPLGLVGFLPKIHSSTHVYQKKKLAKISLFSELGCYLYIETRLLLSFSLEKKPVELRKKM